MEKFDKNFYLSDEFYGILSQAKLYLNMYKRLLNDVCNSCKETLLLSKSELNNQRFISPSLYDFSHSLTRNLLLISYIELKYYEKTFNNCSYRARHECNSSNNY